MRVTFLGTGTSVGVPVITCDCEVCTSEDPRNRRLRAGLLLDWQAPHPVAAGASADDPAPRDVRVLVDTTTDLRQQALRVGLDRVDAVIYTHHHADHVLGLDELRIFNFVHRTSIPLYGNDTTMAALRRTFAYAFDPAARGVPRLDLNVIDGSFELLGRKVVPVPVEHHRMTIFGYRVGDFAYVTDCSGIPASSEPLLEDLEVLVIDALRRAPHPAHFTLAEALEAISRLAPRTAYLTHLSHEFDHESLTRELPEGVHVAYDGLVLDLPDGVASLEPHLDDAVRSRGRST